MSSYFDGKAEICAWIRTYFPRSAEILDVGACDGLWRRLLPEYPNMDAVEAWRPHYECLRRDGYRRVFLEDARFFNYEHYDLVILGDILEHLAVDEAQAVLDYAGAHSRDVIVAVPFFSQLRLPFLSTWTISGLDELNTACEPAKSTLCVFSEMLTLSCAVPFSFTYFAVSKLNEYP